MDDVQNYFLLLREKRRRRNNSTVVNPSPREVRGARRSLFEGGRKGGERKSWHGLSTQGRRKDGRPATHFIRGETEKSLEEHLKSCRSSSLWSMSTRGGEEYVAASQGLLVAEGKGKNAEVACGTYPSLFIFPQRRHHLSPSFHSPRRRKRYLDFLFLPGKGRGTRRFLRVSGPRLFPASPTLGERKEGGATDRARNPSELISLIP